MHCLLFACSRSQIFSAPEYDPATTISSALLNLTASTADVCPDKLYCDKNIWTWNNAAYRYCKLFIVIEKVLQHIVGGYTKQIKW